VEERCSLLTGKNEVITEMAELQTHSCQKDIFTEVRTTNCRADAVNGRWALDHQEHGQTQHHYYRHDATSQPPIFNHRNVMQGLDEYENDNQALY
jgi:hypothetical protein